MTERVCMDCHKSFSIIYFPISLYSKNIKNVCMDCNTIPVCKGILPKFNTLFIKKLEIENVIPKLNLYTIEKIHEPLNYDELRKIFDDILYYADVIESQIGKLIVKAGNYDINWRNYDDKKTEVIDDILKVIYPYFEELSKKSKNNYIKYKLKYQNITGEIDILMDNCIIDIKAVKKCKTNIRQYFIQLLIYYCLLPDNILIDRVGIYDHYNGNMYWLSVTSVSKDKLIEYIKNFRNEVENQLILQNLL